MSVTFLEEHPFVVVMNVKHTLTTKGLTALLFGAIVLASSCKKDESLNLNNEILNQPGARTMATGTVSSGSLLNSSTFEESNAISLWQSEANPGAITRSNTVAREGSYSAKFSINKTDALISGSYRAEIKTDLMPINSERWYGMSVFLPSTYVKDPIPESIFQWHNVPNFKAGETWSSYKFQNPWRLETNNGRLVFVHQYGTQSGSFAGSKSYDLGEYQVGVWTDFVVHFKATFASDGIFELWKNGSKVLTINGPGVYYNDESGPYMKMGIYKWGWSGTGSTVSNRTLYFDQIKIGDQTSSYNDVAPSSASTPAPAPAPEPAPAPAPAGPVVLAVNSGGSAFTASNGITYQADKAYSGGKTYSTSSAIANTTDDVLYQTERSGGNFSYNIPVTNGTYEVTLKFGEIYFASSNQRVFDIMLEGNEVVSNLDLVKTVGSKTAYDVVKTITVTDGTLNITSRNDINNAQLAAFHIINKSTTTAPAPVPAGKLVSAVNAGGGSFTASNGITYQADQKYSGGNVYSTSSAIANTTDDVLYQTERSGGSFGYNIPVSNGTYEVTLRFAEINFVSASQRVFDILLEGNEVISNLDLVRTAGTKTAHDIVKTVTVTDGVLNIKSRNDIDNAQLAAFHIVSK
ncbi:hypothetical protein GZH53_16810 [Flavihumibacter sp. R14]|nr:hypothetical protein [Flavihumibacter soli]